MWRLLPLVLGVCVLTVMVNPPDLLARFVIPARQAYLVLGGYVVTGVGLLLGLPLLVRATADLALRLSSRPTTRLAARRLRAEPATTVRVVAGLTIATFVITGAVGLLAANQATSQYTGERYALEVGPQVHTVFLAQAEGAASTGPAVDEVRSRLAAVPGVSAVTPSYDVEVAGCVGANAYCFNAFVGTCAELQQQVPVSGCDDRRISRISGSWNVGHATPSVVPLRVGDTKLDVPVSGTIAVAAGPPERDWSIGSLGLFVPVSTPALQPLLGAPTYLDVVTGPGTAPRAAVIDAAAALGVQMFAQELTDYQAVQGYALLLATLAVIVLGIGLLAVLISAVDRAIERRRELARQVAVGVPVRVLRGSQLLQTLVPLWLGLVPAVGLGYLALLGYLRYGGVAGGGLGGTVLLLLVSALAGAVVVSAVTLPGISAWLTPALVRRE